MDNDFEVLKEIRKRKQEKAEKYLDDSRERLKEICCTKIRTTMIGAIASVERALDDLLSEKEIKQRFLKLREEILDMGNDHIRELRREFKHYDIHWNRYNYTFRVMGGNDESGSQIER